MSVLLPTERVLALCSPLHYSPWPTRRVTYTSVQKALTLGQFMLSPVPLHAGHKKHAARIAFFVKNSWTDAIEIDVGVPGMGTAMYWPVIDGNHRLAAADFRRDIWTLANVSGCLSYARYLFGVDCENEYDGA